MLRPHTLISCTLLLLVALSTAGEGRPHSAAHEDTPDAEKTDGQKELLLEAVKMGILSSLGMDREPRAIQKATLQELREMHQLYIQKLREMRGNSSQLTGETGQSTISTVLSPGTVEPVKMHWKGEDQGSVQHMQWYRAVFHKKPNIQAEHTLSRAELKISRPIVNAHTLVQPKVREELNVKVNGTKSLISAAWTKEDTLVDGNTTSTQNVMLDISPEVEKWMSAYDGQSLVVDVGMVLVDKDSLRSNPAISLELGLVQPKQRTRRSNKEDDCDQQGWCCRQSVTVSFKDIGWTDWVVAPVEYTMHYCDGTCPDNYKPASMHAQMKSRMHQITKGGTPRPCCVPAAYEPMVIMHYDSRGKLTLTSFNEMLVTKCHCA